MKRGWALALVAALALPACSDDTNTTADTTTPDVTGTSNQYFSTDDYQGPELPLLARRDTDSGYHVRVRSFTWQDMSVPGPSATGWLPPGWCYPTSQYRLSVVSDTVVGVLLGSTYSELKDGLAATAFNVGDADGAPTRVLVLQLDPAITKASVVWGDGAKDSTEPTDGWALLVAAGAAGVDFTLTLDGPGGARTVAAADLPAGDSIDWQRACTEPVAVLPAPGEQPADPAAAEQLIRDRFDRLWSADVPFESKGADLLDDTTGVADALATVPLGSYADASGGAVHSVTQLVFRTPTEAWFTYDIVNPVSNFVNRFGVARLVDGVWKFARAVICQDLALSGVACNPTADSLVPPQG